MGMIKNRSYKEENVMELLATRMGSGPNPGNPGYAETGYPARCNAMIFFNILAVTNLRQS
jgi:hypothetical protein